MKSKTLFISFISFFVAFFISYSANSQSNGFEMIRSLEQLNQIYELLDKHFVDDIKAGNLSKTAIDAMLEELDPYTVFYHESNIEDYKLMTTGQYGGIGALIRRNGEYVYIAEPYEGNPAQVAGLMAGDKILTIDGNDMKDKSTQDVSGSLKGPKDTELEVVVERNGKEEKFKFKRDEIKLPDVPYSGMLKNDIGYIKLNSFTRTAASSVTTSFNELKEQGMKSLILDLRGNGGGLLIEAVKIVNMFIPQGQTVVTTKGRVVDQNRDYKTTAPSLDEEIPVVVLINEGSASASEIVSGSLQDLDRAVVVGTRSYGKGLVQRTYDLDYGAKVKLTIAKYYTPSGRCVQRLNYYDEHDGKSPAEVPDSLITIFKTKNGREVIDGRGIDPDVEVEQKDISRLALTMLGKNIFFDYATQFFFEHESIDSADKFTLSDKDYADFKAYVLNQDFTYSTASEEMLKKLHKTVEQEGFSDDTSEEYEALLNKLTPSKERDLEKFKSEIQEILENEIISRYYYQKGRAINSFKNDPFIDKAIEVLNNSKEYNTILGK